MFLQDAPPDTSIYMIAGYAAFLILTAIYLVSLVVRSHNLHEDLKMLEKMQAESKTTEGKPGRRTTGKPTTTAKRPAKKSTTPKKKAPTKAAKTGRPKRKR